MTLVLILNAVLMIAINAGIVGFLARSIWSSRDVAPSPWTKVPWAVAYARPRRAWSAA